MHPTLLGAIVEVAAILCATSVVHRLIVHREIKNGYGSYELSGDNKVQKATGGTETVPEPGKRRYGASGSAGGLQKGPDGRRSPLSTYWRTKVSAADEREQRLRELLAECNGAAKDLRLAIKEARQARDESFKKVNDSLNEAVAAGLKEYEATIEKAMSNAVAKVSAEFDKLTRIYLGTDAESVKKGLLPIEDLALRQAAIRRAQDGGTSPL